MGRKNRREGGWKERKKRKRRERRREGKERKTGRKEDEKKGRKYKIRVTIEVQVGVESRDWRCCAKCGTQEELYISSIYSSFIAFPSSMSKVRASSK